MQDRPYAPELLEAAADFLEQEVMPQLTGRRRFHTRVTINALRILTREWEHEEPAVRDELSRLTRLLNREAETAATFSQVRGTVRELNIELGRAIRSGALDDRWDEVAGELASITTAKVRIANPRWIDDENG